MLHQFNQLTVRAEEEDVTDAAEDRGGHRFRSAEVVDAGCSELSYGLIHVLNFQSDVRE